MIRHLALAISAIVLGSCADLPSAPAVSYKDGEMPVPAGYQNWPRFLVNVQRPDAKQVRDIYVNTIGAAVQKGRAFADGTVFVMENYAARENPDGTLMTGADGKLVKGNLLRVFLMGKGRGWGASAPEGLANGDWVYASYGADGKPAADVTLTCRACHIPYARFDFVHRYDEYFEQRGK